MEVQLVRRCKIYSLRLVRSTEFRANINIYMSVSYITSITNLNLEHVFIIKVTPTKHTKHVVVYGFI